MRANGIFVFESCYPDAPQREPTETANAEQGSQQFWMIRGNAYGDPRTINSKMKCESKPHRKCLKAGILMHPKGTQRRHRTQKKGTKSLQNSFWLLLPGPGCFWLLLAASGFFWFLLAASGCFWLLLGAFGCFLLPLAASAWHLKHKSNTYRNAR